MITLPEHIQNLQPYQAGKPIQELAREKKLPQIVKLASNENPLGPSPKAIEAITKAAGQIHRYVDPKATSLVEAIAGKYHKKPAEIICGHGSDAMLAYIIMAFTRPGDEVLTSEGTFIGLYVSTKKLGRRLTTVPLKDYALDLDGMSNRITPRTKIVFLANPNNPTGTMFTVRQFEAFLASVPKNVLVILDEAYETYASQQPDYPNGLDYEQENLIVVRTLSKVYGLAGLRVGFAVGPEALIKHLYKVKLPFEPNYLAQVAAAAALDDDEFLAQTVAANNKSLARMRERFDQLGIRQIPTAANFILMLMPSERFAADFFAECLNQGLIVRHVKSFGIPNGIRINSGTDEETTFALNIIEEVHTKLSQSDTAGSASDKTIAQGNEVRFV